MNSHNIPKALFRKVLRYYRHYYTKKTALDEEKILNGMSSQLRQEVVSFLISDMFNRTHLLRSLDTEMMTALLPILKPSQYHIDEAIVQVGRKGEDMHIIIDGRCNVRNYKGAEVFTFQR